MAASIQHITAQASVMPGSGATAMQVFGTVELMEAILLHLSPCDVLRAMQATRYMRDTVNGSSKVQRSIGLLPNEHAHFQHDLWQPVLPSKSLVFDFHSMELHSYGAKYRSLQDWRFIHLVMLGIPPADLFTDAAFVILCPPGGIFFTSALEKLGSRYRQMLPCQPPLQSIRTRVHCKHCPALVTRNYACEEIETIEAKADNHITLGKIQDAVLRARLTHREKCSQKEGRSETTVVIDCRTGDLARDDPLMVQRREETRSWELRGGNRKAWAYDPV